MMKMSELIIASKNGYFSRVIELLQSGISVKCRDRDNATALYWSACRGYARICAVLVKAGSDIDARVKWGSTALHACSDRGHKDCVETLISFGADLNIQNVRGDTPLHLAGYRGYADIVIILIEARADTTLLNEKKKSAEQEARGQGHTRVANILQNHREANLSPPDWDDSGFKRTRREDFNVFPDSDLTTTLRMRPPSSITQTQLNIGLNQLSADRKTGDLGSEFGYQRRFSTGWAVLRETTEPQESEEPCSASSWNGCEKISNLSNGQHSHSDTIAEKRVKHSICVSQLPRPDPLGLDSSPRQKPCSAGDLMTIQSSSFSNSDSQLNENNRPDFTDLGGKSTVPLASKSKLPLAKTNSDFVENQVLRRRLEEVSRYAENLELKLVTSNEKIIDLEDSVREKQSLLKEREEQQQRTDQKVSLLTQMARESETLQLSLAEERSLSATLQGRCEALSDEVQRLRLELKTISDLQSKHQPVGEITPVARIECDAKLSPKQELFDKRAGPSSAGVLADSEECGVTELAKTRQFSPTYSQVLQALKLCIGDSILSDRQLYSLNQRYRQLLQSQCRDANIQQQQALDIANKEWRAGVDYTLLDDRPVNQRDGGHREGTSSLVFRISHHRKTYILKMMINLLDLQSVGHGKGQSLPSFLQYNFSAEYEIPLNLPPHENIIQILHFYEGSTIRFRQHLRLLVPSSLDVPLDMANRTVFMVLQEYPFTLKSLALERRTNQPDRPFGLPDRFLVLLLYQLLSAVAHLVQHDVVHRDIKADNVFLDRRLRPVLADFGFAKRVCESNGDKVMFRDAEQVMAGNSNAWAPELARLNRGGPDSLSTEASLDQVYQKTDAYAVSRMFYGLLRPLVAADDFPLSSAETPHYDEASIPPLPDCISPGLSYVLRQLVLDDPRDRPAARKAMVLVGMMLFGPRRGEVNTPAEFMAFYQAKLIQHLTVPVTERLDDQMPGVLSVEESVTENSPALEVHLLTHTTPQEMWECCKIIRQYSLYL